MKRKVLSLTLCGTIALATAAQAGVIGVNFVSTPTNSPGQIMDPGTSAGIYSRSNWNNAFDNLTNSVSGTVGSLTNDAGSATTASITWTCSNTWFDDQAQGDATNGVGNAQLALGYLDDGYTSDVSNGVDIAVTGIPYGNYTAVLYFSTDTLNGVYTPATVNGGSYTTTGTKHRYSDPNWMNYNIVTVTNLSGPLSITVQQKTGDDRGSISGIQIVESTEGAPPAEPDLAPEWLSDPVNGGSVITDAAYVGSLDGEAIDRNNEPVTYSLAEAFTWLNVAANGDLTGTAPSTAGTNEFLVAASDGSNASTGTLQIIVIDPPSTGDSTAISINLREPNANQFIDAATDAGRGGFVYVNWNDGVDNAGTVNDLIDSDGNETVADVTWSSSGVWGDGTANDDANAGIGNGQLARGYMDDGDTGGGNGVIVTISDIPYDTYHAVLYLATDTEGGTYRPFDFNGASHSTTGSKARYGTNPIWDDTNSIVVSNLTDAALTVTGLTRDGANRSSVAGIQIISAVVIPGDPVTVTIAGPVTAGTEMVLSWTGQAGYDYTVQTNSNLIIANWGDLATGIPGIDGTVTYTNGVSGTEDEVFYQVITE